MHQVRKHTHIQRYYVIVVSFTCYNKKDQTIRPLYGEWGRCVFEERGTLGVSIHKTTIMDPFVKVFLI